MVRKSLDNKKLNINLKDVKMKMKMKLQEKVAGFPDYFKSWVKTFTGGVTVFCLIILSFIPFLSQNESCYNWN